MPKRPHVAVVTGASRGIGRAIALDLARQGYDLGLQARSEARLEEVRSEVEALGRTAVVVPGDVTQAGAAEALIEGTEAAIGPVGVAIAGAGQAVSAPLSKTDASTLTSLFEVNALSAFFLMKKASAHMIEHGIPGRIVVVASTAGTHGMRYTSAYSASKHAVLGLVRSAALELAPKGITVNAVCPGWVDTPMFDQTLANIAAKTKGSEAEARAAIESRIPAGSVLEPEEVAAMVGYVVSDAAARLTGQALVIDGGETL